MARPPTGPPRAGGEGSFFPIHWSGVTGFEQQLLNGIFLGSIYALFG